MQVTSPLRHWPWFERHTEVWFISARLHDPGCRGPQFELGATLREGMGGYRFVVPRRPRGDPCCRRRVFTNASVLTPR